MNKLTLLYAEDDRETLEGTSFLLRNLFSEIYKAKNGEQALELYKEHKPDIILLDINMPKVDGMEVAMKIRQEDETTPIIFLSAHSETQRLLNAIDIGAFSYVIKPFRIEELKKPILKLLDKQENKGSLEELGDDYFWDKNSEELFYKKEKISITKNEMLLTKLLIKNRNRFLSAQDIAYDLYEQIGKEFELNNIVQLISRFRKKVLNDLNIEKFFIENIYGSGYKIK